PLPRRRALHRGRPDLRGAVGSTAGATRVRRAAAAAGGVARCDGGGGPGASLAPGRGVRARDVPAGAAAVIARGLVAGFAGTCALTTAQRIEMKVSGRPPSDLPARVAEGVLGVSLRGRRRELAGTAAHWVNNTASGLGRAALGAAGVRGGAA